MSSGNVGGVDDARRAELAANLAAARTRVDDAERAAGRSSGEVTLLVVTKYFPAADVLRLIELGCGEFGESREPEASRKIAEVRAALGPGASAQPVFDMIGSVQRKKARSVARWARTVHSVDSAPLVEALQRGARAALDAGERTAPLGVLLQVSLDGDAARGGVSIDGLPALGDVVAGASDLHLRGLMAIAPLHGEREMWMAKLAGVHADFVRRFPDATVLSAGMSGDLDVAVKFGSTCVRVGTAILGLRPIP
ncbi:YggS family pyridoxal phosphate enzyme [Gordonia sp. TBRC 11910]|uniref:Pyridoxal phosphate homeostasis protein n=1 Tax=Gordonia asplenii TaxID=2725283 RepID=A0A848KYU3_9ACTN|nr:alanine racemase [Gordonia asplenii]NMO03317.1 YggS family pyridoxal phosphate enzyme [Gordonia asplenii]